jgi:WD40 repeat protein
MTDTGPGSYDGFLSYSHAADDLLAPRLQSGLQRFAKPWWKRRALRVFRDEASLSANPHLWSSITDALDDSEWFVLLLSPDAAESVWVNREIDYWVEHKDPGRILPVVTDGEFGWEVGDVTGNAVPESLRGVFSEEPRWVDLRFARTETQLDLRHVRFRDTVADIAAAIRGIPKDDLASEEVRQHRRTIRTAWTGGIAILALGVAATVGAIVAFNAQQDAEELAIEVQNRAEVATARELAASATGALESDPQLAILLALEGIRATPEPQREPLEALHRALQSNRVRTQLPWESYEALTASGLAAAVDPKGDLVAVSGDGATVHLTTIDGEAVRSLSGGSDPGPRVGFHLGISFDPAGDRIASVDPAGVIRIWDVLSGELSASVPGHNFGPGVTRFSPDGRWLATFITDSSASRFVDLALWEIATWEEQWRVELPSVPRQVVFSPDSERLAIGGYLAEELPEHGLAVVFDVATGTEVFRTLEVPRVTTVGYSHDGTVLAIPRWDGVVRLLSSQTFEEIGRLNSVEVTEMAFSPVGPLLAGRGSDGITVWDYETGRSLLNIAIPGNVVRLQSLDFTADGSALVGDGGLVWDLHAPIGEVRTFNVGAAVDAHFDPAGTRLAVLGGRGDSYQPPGPLTLWDASSGELLQSIPDLFGYYIDIHPEGDLVALYGSDRVALWSLDTAEHIVDLANSEQLLGEFLGGMTAFSPDGDTVAAAGDIPLAGLWSVETGEQIGDFFELAPQDSDTGELTGFFFGVAFTPDGSLLVSGDFNSGELRVFDVASQERISTYDHGAGLFSLTMSTTEPLLASCSYDGTVKVWDLSTDELVKELAHPHWIQSVAFSPDNSKLATTGIAGELTVWDIETGSKELGVAGHTGWIMSVRWHPNGYLTTASLDGTVRVWTFDADELARIARAVVTRSLTDAECQIYLHVETCPQN